MASRPDVVFMAVSVCWRVKDINSNLITKLFFVLFFYYVWDMKGRKPIYQPENLKIGEKMAIKAKNRKFGHQYANAFNKRHKPMEFKFIDEFIERVAWQQYIPPTMMASITMSLPKCWYIMFLPTTDGTTF